MRSLSVAYCLAALTLAAFAQSDRGTITGTITDPAGAVVPNAAVEVKNVDTGTVYPGATTGTGNYTITVPAGNYELSVAVTGFKKFVRQNLTVTVATSTRQDVVLEVGATTETVTINEAAPLLKTESGELSHNVTTERLDNLPVITIGGSSGFGNIRNPLQVITLLPGAAFQNDNTLRINGMPSSSQAIRVEGQDATNGIWREQNQINQAGLDAIQEVAVQTSNFAAEYGQAGGGYFNYTMKSGTNQFHGSGFDYFVNEALNAGTPFTDAGVTNSLKSGQHIRNAQRRNDYGFTVGGPIAIPKVYDGHDKTFFFFSFEQFRETQNISTGIATVPTAAYRNGNFSAALNPALVLNGAPGVDPLNRPLFGNEIYDPNTQRAGPNGSIVRDPFEGNVIPLTRMDPIAAKIQALLPPSTSSALANNYAIPTYSNFKHQTIPSIKIDHSLSNTIKLSGYYSFNQTESPNANGYTQVFTSAEPTDSIAHTVRINYDQTLRPTLLLHLGAGILHTSSPAIAQSFDQSQFWAQKFYVDQFPNIGGISDAVGFAPPVKGGNTVPLGTSFGNLSLKDIKPTANANITWVRGNHTYKFGAEMIVEGFPQLNTSRSPGVFTFGQAETALPWATGQQFSNGATGFQYASFFLGLNGGLQFSQLTDSRLGNHSLGFYAQDSWKVTRKLTLDYGLRYDFVTLLQEQYGRMQNAAFDTPNPAAGGRLGSVIYEATCNCKFNSNYPFAFGPRLGLAYQIDSKTVFRGGAGLAYGSAPNNAFLSYSVPDFYTFSDQPQAGVPASILAQGNPYAPGNPFGNPPISWPDFSPHYPSQVAPGVVPPQSPFISIDRNGGRPPRILQWSIGLQRAVTPNLLVEAAYVGNRGVWWTAPLLDIPNYNTVTPQFLKQTYNLDVTNKADGSLLLTPISSPAVIARFPNLANPNSVYPGFPASQPLIQALRPHPQWFGVPPFLGPPLGDTWYDSLQAKVTKRLSHNLDFQYAFTWQKELSSGVNSDTSYLTPNAPLINDVFNYAQNKQISGFSRPLMSVISFSYTTPKFGADSTGMKALSWAARDWIIGGVLRYQSGAVIRVPASNNNLLSQLGRGPTNNPALWGGGNTFQNIVAGQSFLAIDPNCHCFDPNKTLALNPKAWSDAGTGQFGTSAPYYNDYRWQRQPAESLSLGRVFRIRESMSLNVRAEFQNVFNREFLSAPTATNPTAFTTCSGKLGACDPSSPVGNLTGGFGYVNTINGAGTQPRGGQIVARFEF